MVSCASAPRSGTGRRQGGDPEPGPVGRERQGLDPDDMVLLDQELGGREDGIDQVGRPPERPALLRLLHHGVEPGARQDRADMPAEHPVARQAVLEMGADGILVGDAEMVGLDAALDEDLPVCRPLLCILVHDAQTAAVEPGEIRRQAVEESVDIRCGVNAGGDPDPAIALGTTQALEMEAPFVDAGEPGGFVGDGVERAPAVESPAVIGADEAARAALAASPAACRDGGDIEEGCARAPPRSGRSSGRPAKSRAEAVARANSLHARTTAASRGTGQSRSRATARAT